MPNERKSAAQDAEWEVLPPEPKGSVQNLEALFRWIALLMDELIRLPGTRFRFGIDPLVGLIPGIGDTASAFVSAAALLKAVRHGLPKIVLARMAMNILLNELVGIVPVVGDAFSFWFKSNTRNHQLVKEYIGGRRTARTSDWVFVLGILLALGVIVAAGLFVSLFLIQQLLKLLSGH
ncbi:MAG: DUF4112 domain-containing protein [Chthoniobacterales bacterium]